MTPHKNLLKDYRTFQTPKCISAANKGIFNALGVGTMISPAQINHKNNKISLKNMFYVPDIAFTLISIGYTMTLDTKLCLQDKNA
jgi:hypothetical protein